MNRRSKAVGFRSPPTNAMVGAFTTMEPDWRKIELEIRGLAVQSTHFLGEGWNSRAYLVNNELVFRFPKRPEHWEELEREVRFLAFAADLLTLAVPRYTHMAPDSSAPYGWRRSS